MIQDGPMESKVSLKVDEGIGRENQRNGSVGKIQPLLASKMVEGGAAVRSTSLPLKAVTQATEPTGRRTKGCLTSPVFLLLVPTGGMGHPCWLGLQLQAP